jgi:hypothetical protein
MKITKFIPIIFPFAAGLAACSTDSSVRYHDNEELERPPHIQTEPKHRSPIGENDNWSSSESTKEPLGDKVYKFDSKPMTMRIKLPFNTGWYAVRLALNNLEADIVTFDRKEGNYLVNYKPSDNNGGESGLLQGFLSGVLGGHPETSRYQILVKAEGSETEVTVSEAKNGKKEKYVYNPDGFQEPDPIANPENLFENLFNTLREDVVMKPFDKSEHQD